jgi:beta-lactamase regulating signal transducer with metallopeptidase domain
MWESVGEIFSWTARASLYAVGVIFIIVLVQILLRRALSERWSYALWMILLARLVIPVGLEWEMSLWGI